MAQACLLRIRWARPSSSALAVINVLDLLVRLNGPVAAAAVPIAIQSVSCVAGLVAVAALWHRQSGAYLQVEGEPTSA